MLVNVINIVKNSCESSCTIMLVDVITIATLLLLTILKMEVGNGSLHRIGMHTRSCRAVVIQSFENQPISMHDNLTILLHSLACTTIVCSFSTHTN